MNTNITKLNKRLRKTAIPAVITAFAMTATAAIADDDFQGPGYALTSVGGDKASRADGHAPIGVMADHGHKTGEIMLSVRYMRMWMEGNRIGENSVSPEQIVTTVPNRFFGTPGQPPTLRVVPTEMSMDMYMLGAMYGLTDQITLMAMVNYISKEMKHITFQGGMGTNRLGTFVTESEGFGDTTLAAMYRLLDVHNGDSETHVLVSAGVSLPTGSLSERDKILTPMGDTSLVVLPYPMQLGSGTYDFILRAGATHRINDLSLGAQYSGTFRTGENSKDYTLGDIHEGTAWAQYQLAPWISIGARVKAMTQDSIDGIDSRIVAPVQTADPNFQGGDRVDVGGSINLIGQPGEFCGHRLAFEYMQPIYQDLNGPQLETDYTFMVGWQKALGDC